MAADLGIGADQLQQSDIKEITLTPRKISRDNGGTHPYHIDCALSIKSTKVFTAKFWVKEPGESSEYRQIDAKNYLTGNPVARTTKATICLYSLLSPGSFTQNFAVKTFVLLILSAQSM